MREAQALVTTTRTQEPPALLGLPFDAALEAPPPPAPLRRLGAADRIREALRRWLEEDM
jgi:hypothetical protein